jgi:membrane-associated protease RseP (regulator of RpoE activity)
MFDELSTQSAEYQSPKVPTQSAASQEIKQLETVVSEVMAVEHVQLEGPEHVVARFVGRLIQDSETAFQHLDNELKAMDFYVHLAFHEATSKHVIVVLRGRFNPPARPVWPNVVLLILTIFSTMLAGAGIGQEFNEASDIFNGLPYALSVLLILGAHEMGHYFAARYHKVSVTLPYFIPLPFISIIGTMGAFIQLREPMRSRKQLFDIGISGPLAGLIFAIPILIIGVATANVERLPTEEDCVPDEPCGYYLEGNSILYATTKYIIHGKWLPNDVEDMTINQLSFAGWTGLFATALNLIPLGQLDGGHIIYTLVGKRSRYLFYPLMGALVLLAILNAAWLPMLLIIFLVGRSHAVPMNDVTPLDPARRVLGIFTLVLFVFIFTPNPFTAVIFQ